MKKRGTGNYSRKMNELETPRPILPRITYRVRRISRREFSEGRLLPRSILIVSALHTMAYYPIRKLAVLVSAVFLVLALPSETTAQTSFQIGPRVGIDIGDIEDPYAGIDVRITSEQLPVIINPTFDYYFVGEDKTLWSLAGNIVYPFGAEDRSFTFYGGVGLGMYRFSAEGDVSNGPFRDGTTDVGANFLLGTTVSSAAFTPFAELRFTPIFSEGGPSLFGLTAGILINF